jgi:acyl carrier protein
MESQVRSTLRDFVLSAYLFGDESRMPADEDSLLESGVLDSTGVLELIEFLEEKYGIEVADAETVPQNLGSISTLTRYVLDKMRRTAAAGVL